MQVRPTRAEIDLDALAHNLAVVRTSAPAARILAVVKADAYGHGLLPVARRLAAEGIDGFGVALVEEGLALRDAGIDVPILVLNGIYDGAHAQTLRAGLTPVVYDLSDVEAFHAAAGPDAPADVHLKVDTGMSRLGVPWRRIDAFLDGLERFDRVRIRGLMTHLSSAEDDPEATSEQLTRFEGVRARLRARGHAPRTIHAANSAATLLRGEARFDMVRAGVVLYGVRPGPEVDAALRPVMRIVTSVARVTTVEPGTAVGYARTWRAARSSRIATLAIGYGDGFMRHLSNRGEVLIRGRRCPIVGLVSMDLTGVDVTELDGCERGEEAVVLGVQGDERLTAEQVGAAAGTIGYEVLCSIAPRVPRVYRGEGAPAGGRG
ncbi:MAG TPA: alanine racemase [Sandaracinaceae bacterium LLY-WYZ-13_1]|nr:alanine racemase [Sandaracinaceae bacterium LLY-WYZ-13_1]